MNWLPIIAIVAGVAAAYFVGYFNGVEDQWQREQREQLGYYDYDTNDGYGSE